MTYKRYPKLTLDTIGHVRSARADASLRTMTSSDVGPTGIATMFPPYIHSMLDREPSFAKPFHLCNEYRGGATVKCSGFRYQSLYFGDLNTDLSPPRCQQRQLLGVEPHGTAKKKNGLANYAPNQRIKVKRDLHSHLG